VLGSPALRLSQQSAKWKSRRMTSKRGSCMSPSSTAGYAVGAFSELEPSFGLSPPYLSPAVHDGSPAPSPLHVASQHPPVRLCRGPTPADSGSASCHT
jgi:hypothetical protein